MEKIFGTNADNWMFADPEQAKRFEVFKVSDHESWPVIGAVLCLTGAWVPATWDKHGNCIMFGECTRNDHPRTCERFDLIKWDKAFEELERQFQQLWPFVDSKYCYATVNQDGRPAFWTEKPLYNERMDSWHYKETSPYLLVWVATHMSITTRLPRSKTLVVRPGHECRMAV